jgi:hypothetical protein
MQKPVLNNTSPILNQLNEAILFEITRAMALPQTDSARTVVRIVFGKATRRFSKMVLELDHVVEQNGSSAGARWLLRHFVRSHTANGVEIIPKDGPLIIAANHPASYDGIVISAYINRPDYKIVIGEVPPYRYLPNISRIAIFSPPVKNTIGRT